MPKGLILTAVIVLALYVSLTVVSSGLLSVEELAASEAPIALLASKIPLIGNAAGVVVAIMAIIVVIGSLSSCIMFQPELNMQWQKMVYSLNILHRYTQNMKHQHSQSLYSVSLLSS